MLLSTKTIKNILSFTQTSSTFAGNDMDKNYQVSMTKSRKAFDYQSIKLSDDFKNNRNERVKELKCVFV